MCVRALVLPPLQANLAAVKVLPTRSAAVRSYAESHLLEALAGRLATVALSGFMFFGSSVLMSDKVCLGRQNGWVCVVHRACSLGFERVPYEPARASGLAPVRVVSKVAVFA